jgi:hypothetical protein
MQKVPALSLLLRNPALSGLALGLGLGFLACSADPAVSAAVPAADAGSNVTPPPSPASDAGAAPVETGPFAPQPDESEGLVNVSADLDALLEKGTLKTACAQYRGGKTDRRSKLRCGKAMFFYESFGTLGVPAVIVKFMAKNFPDELGIGFSKLGLVPDPTSEDSLPLGFGPTTKINGTIDALAFTCASCHFAQLPDGRYAVGAPNHRYDYGKHILAITIAPGLGMGTGNPADHDPLAVTAVKPIVDRLSGSLKLKAEFGLGLVGLLGAPQPTLSKEVESWYASWRTGTMDFMIAPLPVDDDVHVVSKIIGLWGVARPEEAATSGMSSSLLGWSGSTKGLDEFIKGFAALGGVGNLPTDEETSPLIEYIYSLRAPSNPAPPPADLVATGQKLYAEKQCASCHDGPRGSGKRAYTFDEIGTDSELSRWADADRDGKPCCNTDVVPAVLTGGVKSPRLVGMWALERFLHNGSLSSLEQLFCLDDGRPSVGTAPMRSDGHAFTCNDLTSPEKRALIAYLRAH